MITQEEFESAIIKNKESALYYAFIKLSKYVYDHKENATRCLDREDLIQEGVYHCFEKLKKYNYDNNGSSYNYFVKILNSLYSVNTRAYRNYDHLKEKYKHYLEKTRY